MLNGHDVEIELKVIDTEEEKKNTQNTFPINYHKFPMLGIHFIYVIWTVEIICLNFAAFRFGTFDE